MIDRRSVLLAAAYSFAFSALGRTSESQAATAAAPGTGSAGLKLGKPQPFSFDALIQEMQQRATEPFKRETSLPADVLDKIDYGQHGKIKFNTDHALFRDGPGEFPVTFFHLGKYFQTPVRMYALSADKAQATEILYDATYFTMPADSPGRQLPKGAGFAGFRFQESRRNNQPDLDWRSHDWVAFLGASYFRAIGELAQYGLSSRGVAVNVSAPGTAEEFPSFTRFYFEPQTDDSHTATLYAALDGPSVTGAFQFVMHRDKAVVMEVQANLFLRKDVVQFGVAPMTTMYWYSETSKPAGIDWRPEIHDSDGLALWTGAGEYIWRPLNDPRQPTTSTFEDKSPRGFGLLQRDRNFDHYLDGVRYERRPSLWVEPLDDWGAGEVQLVELHTDDETEDNVVAMWVPKQPAKAGSKMRFRYRLHWTADGVREPKLARCVATRRGRGGEPGQERPKTAHKFVVEFLGGNLANLPFGEKPTAMLSASTGTFSDVFTEAVPDGVAGHWRALFDFTPGDASVADIRLYLNDGNQPLSETWMYQYHAS
jgi:glucans biosynthesis protein